MESAKHSPIPYDEAQHLDAELIPVIDITPLRDGSDPTSVAKALHRASQGLGFVYIKGHGISEAQINAARECAAKFFHQSTAAKASVTISAKHRGWLGPNASKMADDVKPDLKESFLWGYEDEAGNTPEDHPLRGANQWPAEMPDMQSRAMAYFHSASQVAKHLLRGFAIGLDLSEDFFLQNCAAPLTRASMVYYPRQPADVSEAQFGVGPHTDFGVLTVLCQDDVGGLQVEDINGNWVHAPPIEGTLIVNVADLLSRWTNRAYKSTPHRVINTSGRERISLVLAFDPDPETVIDASQIPTIPHANAEPAISCGDYLIWRFEKAFAYRKKDTGQ